MNKRFYLRKPNGRNKTSILFYCYFRNENKKFIYSIKKSILPINWDFNSQIPFSYGKNLAPDRNEISLRISEVKKEFEKVKFQCELTGTEFSSKILLNSLDERLGITVNSKKTFYEVYDLFINEKIKLKHWSKSTIKRYKNIKNLLKEFEDLYKYKITFATINQKFYTEFTDYCYEYKNHFTNTFNRNIGLIKTFLYWALKNDYTFNKDFMEFVKPRRVVTRQEALTIEDIKKIYNFNIEDNSLEKVRDVFVFQCLTGMRYSELSKVNKRNIFADGNIFLLTELKDITKPPREIPLVKLAKDILLKYDYNLPLVANQDQNTSIKDILKDMGDYNKEVEYIRTKGVEQHKFVEKYYNRISTHTARRSFITIMRNFGVPDKTIMSITGHRDIKSFNIYHQVDNEARVSAVSSVFGSI